jgi:hypothetical protein
MPEPNRIYVQDVVYFVSSLCTCWFLCSWRERSSFAKAGTHGMFYRILQIIYDFCSIPKSTITGLLTPPTSMIKSEFPKQLITVNTYTSSSVTMVTVWFNTSNCCGSSPWSGFLRDYKSYTIFVVYYSTVHT